MKHKIHNQKILHASRFTLHEKGYSLIELIVAIGVFATVVSVAGGAFAVSLKGQKKTITLQNTADNARYAMEVMAKELRMMAVSPAKPIVINDSGGACGGVNCRILFYSNMPHRDPSRQLVFYLDSAAGKIMFDDDISDAFPAESITPSSVRVGSLVFDASGISATPIAQPRVTVIMQMESIAAVEVNTSINVQTTISPRTL